MVNLKLTKMQIQEILVWGAHYSDMVKEVGMKFEKDEIELYAKIFLTSRKGETVEESMQELYARNPEWENELNPFTPPTKVGGFSGVSK